MYAPLSLHSLVTPLLDPCDPYQTCRDAQTRDITTFIRTLFKYFAHSPSLLLVKGNRQANTLAHCAALNTLEESSLSGYEAEHIHSLGFEGDAAYEDAYSWLFSSIVFSKEQGNKYLLWNIGDEPMDAEPAPHEYRFRTVESAITYAVQNREGDAFQHEGTRYTHLLYITDCEPPHEFLSPLVRKGLIKYTRRMLGATR